MKNLKKIVLLFLVIALFFNCKMNPYPKCNDAKVQALLVELASEQMKNKFLTDPDISKALFFSLVGSKVYQKVFNSKGYGDAPNYTELNQYRGKEKKMVDFLNRLDSIFHFQNLIIKDIVISALDKDLGKCECEAQLFYTDTTFSFYPQQVRYSAQYTEDRKVIVKLISMQSQP